MKKRLLSLMFSVLLVLLPVVVHANESDALESETETEQSGAIDFYDKSGYLFKDFSITAAEVIEIYNEYEELFKDYPEDPAEAEKFEASVAEKVAANHNLTPEQADNAYLYVSFYGVPDAPTDFTLKYGELLDTNINGTGIVIKAKISPSYSNNATIAQNYYNVCDIIRKQGGDKYETISYWAVADMTDGSEGKVISFDVPSDVIEYIATNDFPDNRLGEFVNNLWILPSLQ